MSAPHFLTHATIRALDDGDRTLVINPANELAVRMVEGVQVQNGLYISEDKTTYFSFPDLSVRLAGRYQLLFSLIRLGPGLGNSPAVSSSQRPFVSPAHTNAAGTVVASTTSAEFEVFAPRRFPGVVFSSVLTRRLGERGLKVHVRNRNASDQEQTQYGSGAASSHP
ncbi:hypothetical protein OC835_005071 [Tilletia horrida]|nr:hypothetical protein OC835_005071 [Tilletia horrida]KAK0556636.1 hypothetical protein OC844_005801 [Tilletia horrida]